MLRRLLGRTATTLLVLAVLVVAGWFVFSSLTGATLITFRTGSMSPTMPQGAVAVSMPVTAAEIEVGDVVTVQRSGEELPVTHRVVEVRGPGEATSPTELPSDARELVLKGDDNDTVDMRPYVVTEARRAVAAVPHLGAVLMLLQSPLGMGVMTVLAGLLTAWAFWPSRKDSETDAADDENATDAVDAGAVADAEPTEPAEHPEHAAPAAPLTRRERRLAELAGTKR